MKNIIYNTVWTVQKSNMKNRWKRQETPNTHIIHDNSFSWFITDISIKSGGYFMWLFEFVVGEWIRWWSHNTNPGYQI
jgi:hypothetical protein